MKQDLQVVRIPKPCHEDWDVMTPTEKGRHCSVCSTTVVDFSASTDAEILRFLNDKAGQKTCGRFSETQLNRPLHSRINLHRLPRNMSITKIFFVATFLAFGTMLFSCTNHLNQKLGEMEIRAFVAGNDKNAGYPDNTLPSPDSTVNIDEPFTMKGDAVVSGIDDDNADEEKCVKEFIKGKIYRMGAPGIEPEEVQDSILTISTSEPDTINTGRAPGILGAVAVINAGTNDSTLKSYTKEPVVAHDEQELQINTGPELTIFPNPSVGRFTVSYTNLKRIDVDLRIFDANGLLLKNVVQIPQQHEGQYNIPIDLSNLPNGLYVVSLIKNGKRTAKSIVVSK